MADAWSTVIEREPEWDDLRRNRAEALALYADDCCPGCGMHKSILDDPEHNALTFESRVCAVCRGQDIYRRVVADTDCEHAEQNKGAKPTDPRPSDGRHIYMRGMTSEEVEKAKAATSPTPHAHPVR